VNEEYDLRESVRTLGKLSPILKDAHGNVIDGLHRLELFPDWPTITNESITTPEQLEAARLAVNTNRRVVSSSEIDLRVGLLVKAGLKAEQIIGMTGLSKATIYRHMPQELKKAEKVEAGQKGGQVLAKAYENSALTRDQTVKTRDCAEAIQQTVTTHDAVSELVECERCHVHARECKAWRGHQLCGKCFERAEFNPGAYESFFSYRDKSKARFPPPTEVREARPRDFDSWPQRKAAMSPQKSALELSVIQDLQTEGLPIETDVEFCVQKTIPDGYMRHANTLIYIDGPVHEGREDRDEQLRERVQKLQNCRIIAVKYERDSKEERERVKAEIKQQLEVLA
jgi:transposase